MNVVFLGVADRGISGIFAELLPKPDGGQMADSRFPGTVSHDYQEKEALYNAYLRQVEAQQARGWQVRKGWQYRPVAGQPAVFVVAIADRHGRPVTGAAVDGRFLRTSNSRDDVGFVMHEVAPGEYRVQLEMPLHGLWRTVLRAFRSPAGDVGIPAAAGSPVGGPRPAPAGTAPQTPGACWRLGCARPLP